MPSDETNIPYSSEESKLYCQGLKHKGQLNKVASLFVSLKIFWRLLQQSTSICTEKRPLCLHNHQSQHWYQNLGLSNYCNYSNSLIDIGKELEDLNF